MNDTPAVRAALDHFEKCLRDLEDQLQPNSSMPSAMRAHLALMKELK